MNKNVVIGILVVVVAALGWYFYQESQKSDLEKAAEEIADGVEDAAKEIEKELN